MVGALLLGNLDASGFDFKTDLFGPPSRINARVVACDPVTGTVRIEGGAAGLAGEPVWSFGDGEVKAHWFPIEHTYATPRSTHIVKVSGVFRDGVTNSAELMVRFTAPSIERRVSSETVAVTIPSCDVALASRMPEYGFAPTLTHFDNRVFTPAMPRSTLEYLLTVAATIQYGLVNSNLTLVDRGFRQILLRDPKAGGMYSIWYSTPIAFGVGDYGLQGAPEYSSFFHEMGHNFTLNFPAPYRYGGRIDGDANAIYSETLAQIFQHATAWEIINRAAEYGIPADLVFEIRQSARLSMAVVRSSYDRYVRSGAKFASWNDPTTPQDETFDTFMTVAYKFFAHAESGGRGYKTPTQRLCQFLGMFDADLHRQYSQIVMTEAAEEFRSTLFVAGLSHAFHEDLRSEFRTLRFPVDDRVYDQLTSRMRAE
jgi:hypothetical protein